MCGCAYNPARHSDRHVIYWDEGLTSEWYLWISPDPEKVGNRSKSESVQKRWSGGWYTEIVDVAGYETSYNVVDGLGTARYGVNQG